MSQPTARTREFTGTHMLLTILAFFGVVIGVNLVMATIATSSWTGLIVKNSYVASQEFNGKIAAARRQDAMGWTSALSADGKTLALSLMDAAGQPLNGLSISGKVYTPVAEARDAQVTFQAAGSGRYLAPANLTPGVWEAAIDAKSPSGEHYLQIFRFHIKDAPG